MRWFIGKKARMQGEINLEIAIVIALLVLVVVIIMATKINKEIPQEVEPLVQRIEKRKIVDMEFPLSTPGARVELPSEESEGERVIIEALRQRQMQGLKDDIKKMDIEKKEEIVSGEEADTTTQYNIHPGEDDIERMEEEGVLLY